MIRVWKYDTWGNQKDGFEVNDRYELATYNEPEKESIFQAKDADVIGFLKNEGHLAKGTHLSSFRIEGDGDRYLTIDYKNCPIMEITKEE
jgi:hypothetical protein